MDREAFFSFLSLESMMGEHIDLIRLISEHVDDCTFEEIVTRYLTRYIEPEDTVLDAVSAIEYALDGSCEDYDDTPVDDDDVVKAALLELRGRFAHIELLFTIGRRDLAIESMKGIADALSTVKDTHNYVKYEHYFESIESDIRKHIDSGTPEEWFGLEYD